MAFRFTSLHLKNQWLSCIGFLRRIHTFDFRSLSQNEEIIELELNQPRMSYCTMKIAVSFVVLGVLLTTSCDASLRATSKSDGSIEAQHNPKDNGVESKTIGGRHLSDETPPKVDMWAKLLSVDPRKITPVHHQIEDNGERQLTNTPTQSQITSLQLINANTDQVIVTLKDGMVIALDTIPNMTTPAFNINATFVNGTGIRSVKYGYNNTNRYRVETTAPYTFCGNNKTDYFSCSRLGLGTHTVTVTPYAKANAAGAPGTPITIKFTIIASDVSPPKLLNFTALTPTTVDVTNGNKNITVLVTAQDDTAGFEFASVGYGNSSEVIAEQSNFYKVIYYEAIEGPNPNPIAGAPVAYNVTMTVKKYHPAGMHALNVVVGDTKFNFERNNGTDLIRKGFVSSITVVNSGQQDTVPPELVSLVALDPLTINVSSANVAVRFQITVQDALSGFNFGYLITDSADYYDYAEFAKPSTRADGIIFLDHGPELPPGVPHVFNVSLTFEQGLPPGSYDIKIEMTDGVRNWNFLNSTKLAAMGFPSKVTVVA